ncbi:uncharacterized protein LOC112552657 [Pogonomyrmex barbatus]|uniref:Uncharacterized protein LOC112552657 n=1 Tax=Pogonomyrmex barbatus TaxID=144034 RepID=A0A8N1S5X2_9HYME|nr:uncharacterized protein LOC112552657 [Pogonomyrmex barbatus]
MNQPKKTQTWPHRHFRRQRGNNSCDTSSNEMVTKLRSKATIDYTGSYKNITLTSATSVKIQRVASKLLLSARSRTRLAVINWQLELSTAVTIVRMRIGWREFTCLENQLQQPTPPQNFSPEGQR